MTGQRAHWWQALWHRFRFSPHDIRIIPLDRLLTAALSAKGHVLLRLSPHVAFLEEFGEAPEVGMATLRQTAYYRHALDGIRVLGSFFGITDPERLVEQARYFLDLYQTIQRAGPHAVRPRCRPIRRFRYEDRYPIVAEVDGGHYYVIVDGHHRCAACYAAGHTAVPARGMGKAPISMAELVRSGLLSNAAASAEGATTDSRTEGRHV